MSNEQSATSATKKPEHPDYRRVEKLIALLLYEFSPAARGCGPVENMGDMFEWAREMTIDPPRPEGIDPDADMTAAEMDEIDRRCCRMAEAIARAFIAMGLDAELEAWVEGLALQRSQCDAKFKVDRATPLTEDEQRELARGWDETYAKAKAAGRAGEVAS